ncbi:MAG TPA: ABC transporter permease [Candidatus Aquilonibacter sp.]
MNVRLLGVHTAALARELLRVPAFAVPTVLFPAMFYTIFGLPYARQTSSTADAVLCAFIAFAVIGVTLFQFGVGIAVERGRPWERYLRTLPVSLETRMGARILVAMAFGLASAGLVAIVARGFSPVSFDAGQWLVLAVYAAIGAVPFVLIGIAIAYWVPPRAALPITNIVYLLASFAGGLWIPPQMLPSFAAAISPYLPTRQYAELLWSIANDGHAVPALEVLAFYTLIFAAVAAIGYRRDERVRYA